MIIAVFTYQVEAQTGGCPLICPANYSPVCGQSPGGPKTYSNQCALDAENCRNGGGIRKINDGQCN